MVSADKPLLSETYGGPLGDLPTLWGAFASRTAETPDALALACTHQAPGLFGLANLALDDDTYRARPYLRWSYQSLHDGILRLIVSWRALGVREGATMVMFMHNGAEYVLATYALLIFFSFPLFPPPSLVFFHLSAAVPRWLMLTPCAE